MQNATRSGVTARAGRSVLLVDDNEDDRELALLAVHAVAAGTVVYEAADGLEALDWLRTHTDRPAVVLLDLKMPRLDGAGVLMARLQEEALRSTPVAVFTTSRAADDVSRCYDLGANVYVTKPDSADELERVMADVLRVFLDHAELPAG